MLKKVNPFLLPIFRSALFIVVGLSFAAITNQSLEQTSQWWSSICVACNIMTIFLLVNVFKSEGISYREVIGYKKGKNSVKGTLLIIMIMILFGMGGMYGFGFLIYGYVPVTMIQPIPIWLAITNFLSLPISVVFAELPLYLGYSLNGIEKITNNKALAIGYTMFFYALQHSFIPLLFDWKHVVFRFLSFFPLMIIFGIVYIKKRDLTQFMIGHATLDLATAIQILVTTISPAIFESMKSMAK